MKKIKIHYKLFLKIILVIGIFSRLWLIMGSNWYVNINSYFDSHLEINSAVNILAGNWMGAYDKFILCKNPSYPLFLALLSILHVPYALGLGLFIILTTFIFVKSIEPLLKNDTLKIFIFLLVLFNPVGFSHEAVYNYRNALVPWAILVTISCIIGIYLRKDEKIKKILPWSVTGMVFMGFFWLLREDSIWFLPFALVAFIITIAYWISKKVKIKKLLLNCLLAFMPIFGIISSELVVSTINYYAYGIFATNDRTKTASAEALGLLIKIDDGSDLDEDVWVSDKAIKLAKKVSPTFASLNLKAFENWPKYGDYSIWAFRDSLADSGYYKDAKSTEKVYKKIVKELKAGFANGKLKEKKAIQLSSTSGIYTVDEMLGVIPIGFASLKNHIGYTYNKLDLEKIENSTSEADIILYEKVLDIDLLRSDNELSEMNADNVLKLQNQNHMSKLYHNLFISKIIMSCYKWTGWLFFVLGMIGYVFLLTKVIKKDKKIKNKYEVLIIMTGLLLISYLNAYLVGLWGIGFNLNANNELFEAYTTVQFLTIQLFELLGLIYFIEFIKEKINYIKKCKGGHKNEKK